MGRNNKTVWDSIGEACDTYTEAIEKIKDDVRKEERERILLLARKLIKAEMKNNDDDDCDFWHDIGVHKAMRVIDSIMHDS